MFVRAPTRLSPSIGRVIPLDSNPPLAGVRRQALIRQWMPFVVVFGVAGLFVLLRIFNFRRK